MKLILLFLLLFSVLQAEDPKVRLFDLYEQGDYKRACNYGIRKFNKFSKDESLVSLYAFSCLKSDFVDRLSIPISILKKSSDGRKNAAYLSIILMQKKLLYHALIDEINLSAFSFPSTDTTLSKVFDLYSKNEYEKRGSKYYLNDDTLEHVYYKLFLKKHSNINKIIIQEYHDNRLTTEHVYR
jgi:hypothetical protein